MTIELFGVALSSFLFGFVTANCINRHDRMIEKRFTYEYDEYNGNLFDNKMNTFYHIEDSDENIEVLCDRLNWLVEENEQLKSKNRGLKSELQIFKEDVTYSNLQINKLTDENEQLKADKQSLIEFIKKEFPKSHKHILEGFE